MVRRTAQCAMKTPPKLMHNLAHRYLTDILNMLQGVYFFWAFVCTRRILGIVLGSEKVDSMDRFKRRVYR